MVDPQKRTIHSLHAWSHIVYYHVHMGSITPPISDTLVMYYNTFMPFGFVQYVSNFL